MNSSIEMRVTKRNGQLQDIAFDKILERVKKLGQEANIQINFSSLVMKVIDQLYDTIPTGKIDELAAEQCAVMSTNHLDYAALAGRIVVSNHQKNTEPLFSNVMKDLYEFKDSKGENKPLISQNVFEFTQKYANEINSMIDHNRDYLIDYFGFKTLERAYLFKINNIIVERPQHMWMRVSIGIHYDFKNPEESLRLIKETYDLMSQKFFTHATPTLFNAGTPRPQLSSCYLIAMEDDSIDGIYNTLGDCAQISKYSGGIGLHIHNIRAKGSHIQGTNGKTDGLVPMLRVFNSTARYVNQSGKRNGSFAIYLEPWHPDIEDFLELRKNHGDEELKARDLFYALWISDLFMERVKENKSWSLFCPHECSGLDDVYGDKFKILYEKYEVDGVARKVVNARDLWFKILDAQMETGTPYILFKDACNQKTNQQNIGTIKSSNLCTEIIEYSDKNETAVCNLASIALPAFVNPVTKQFDYNKLHQVVKVVTNNLNRVIDINFYPTEKTKTSNFRHRPIGIGVQGLADTFILMDLPFHSDEAKEVNKLIFETIYHAALEKSNEISIERTKVIQELLKKDHFKLLEFLNKFDNTILSNTKINKNLLGTYSTFVGSPASKGILQFDMWHNFAGHSSSLGYNWDALKTSIVNNGLRNSLLVAPMPTASTAQILGNNECFEPYTSNIYTRRVLSGEFIIVNKHLLKDLVREGLWNKDMRQKIMAANGSIQNIQDIPQRLKDLYKTAWEISQKAIIEQAADRGAYICQSQSLNIFMENANFGKLTSMHFYGWEKGLKTGMYYLRTKAATDAIKFTVDKTVTEEPKAANIVEDQQAAIACSLDDPDGCEMCSG